MNDNNQIDLQLFDIVAQTNPHRVNDNRFLEISQGLSGESFIRATFIAYLEREPSKEEINFWLADFQMKKYRRALPRELRQRVEFRVDPARQGLLRIYQLIARCFRVIFSGNRYIEILDIVNAGMFNKEDFWGTGIDQPRKRMNYNDSKIEIAGWMLGKNYQVISLKIMLGKKKVKEIPVNVFRSDVLDAHGVEKDGVKEYCGYKTTVSLGKLPGEGTLNLIAVFSGENIPPIEVIKIKFQK